MKRFQGDTVLGHVGSGNVIEVYDGSLTIKGGIGQDVVIRHYGIGDLRIEGSVGSSTRIQTDGSVTFSGSLQGGQQAEDKIAGWVHNPGYRGVTVIARGDIIAEGRIGCRADLHAGGSISAYSIGEVSRVNARNGSVTIREDVGHDVAIRQNGDGHVFVGGHVGSSSSVNADGNVTVEKTLGRGASGRSHIRGVSIKTAKGITVKAGVGNRAELQAGGDVAVVSLASDSVVKAGGNVSVTYDIHNDCRVYAGGRISAQRIGSGVTLHEVAAQKSRGFLDRIASKVQGARALG